MNQDVNLDVDRALQTLSNILQSVRTEFTSIWFPVQIGLILVAALIGLAVTLLMRRRGDPLVATAGWPSIARQLVAAVLANLGLIAFLVRAARMDITIRMRSGRSRSPRRPVSPASCACRSRCVTS